MRDKLATHLRSFSTAPFLFVGSGFSRRYLETDSWQQLLQRFAGHTRLPYEYYRASAADNYPAIASKISEKFHEIWWVDPAYTDQRAANAQFANSPESALKIEISKYLLESSSNSPTTADLNAEMDTLRKAVIDGIITTNWDTLLETCFPDFKPFIGQDQLLFADSHGVGEIYKIHGCATQPNSLVLTAADYERFTDRNAYLAAKLMTIFVEHPVIFLGYSLSDPNVSQILRSIGKCLTQDNISQLRDRLIFISWSPDSTEEKIANANILVPDGYNIPVLEVSIKSFMPVFEALVGLQRRFPAKVLRRLKEHVYTLVNSNDPKGRLYVKDIDESTDDTDEIEIVFGVGAINATRSIGYRAITREDLIQDVLEENREFDATKVIHEAIPRLLKHNSYVPIFRYLRLSGKLSSDGILNDLDSLDPRVAKAAQANLATFGAPSAYYKQRAAQYRNQYKTFAEFCQALPPDEVVMYGAEFPEHAYDSASLRNFLTTNQKLLAEANSLIRTQYVKLVCVYDILAHNPMQPA